MGARLRGQATVKLCRLSIARDSSLFLHDLFWSFCYRYFHSHDTRIFGHKTAYFRWDELVLATLKLLLAILRFFEIVRVFFVARLICDLLNIEVPIGTIEAH
jgi:hypothetical protein